MGIPFTNDRLNEAALLDQAELPGRKTELRQFLKALTLARAGQGKAIFLGGNEGIGKSSLLKAFLELAQNGYGCPVLSIPMPRPATPQLLFANIIESLLSLADRVVGESLREIDQALQPLGLRWSRSDLVQMVSLLHLQESVGSKPADNSAQLAQSIYAALPFFKRSSASVKQSILQLARVLQNPWLTLAVSVMNPINPQVQGALMLVRQNQNLQNQEKKLLLPGFLSETSLIEADREHACLPESDQNGEVCDSRSLNQLELSVEEEVDGAFEPSAAAPTLSNLQKALSELLVFINNGLRQQQSALVIAFDQWEALTESPEDAQREIKELLSEVIRRTVDQRDFRLMLIISCRSENESYSVGGSLFNALRIKYLTSPLNDSTQQRFLREHFKAIGIQCEEPVIAQIGQLCQGNPAWMNLLARVIANDAQQTELKTITSEIYEERYAVSHPSDLLELLYTRLQLGFVGEETLFLKSIGKLVAAFSYRTFHFAQLLELLPLMEERAAFAQRLLEALLQQGFVTPVCSNESGEPIYELYSPFLLAHLKQRVRPLQEEIPAPDKIASLRRVLPMTIQSGELTREKIQEFLAMASALEDAELTRFVEQTLIEALAQEGIGESTRVTLVESLGLLGTHAALDALVKALESLEEAVREAACLQLIPLADATVGVFPRTVLLESVLKLLDDPAQGVRYQAYRFISLYNGETEQVLPVLLRGAESEEPSIRLVAVAGLVHRRLNSPEVREILRQMLEKETDPQLFKLLLKGLQQSGREEVTPILMAYLEKHSQGPLWMEALMVLLHLDLKQALPWVSPLLSESGDTDLKLQIVKRLGSRINPDVERILVNLLRETSGEQMPPELRWMVIRSLGWIGQSMDTVRILEAQVSLCRGDEILSQALKSALRQIAERTATAVAPEEKRETVPLRESSSVLCAPALTAGNGNQEAYASGIESVWVSTL